MAMHNVCFGGVVFVDGDFCISFLFSFVLFHLFSFSILLFWLLDNMRPAKLENVLCELLLWRFYGQLSRSLRA